MQDTGDVVERILAGDREAYGTLWARYHVPLRAFVRHQAQYAHISDPSIDDLLQETHAEAVRNLASFDYRRPHSFFFWLCGIARLLIANRWRKLSRRRRAAPMAPWATSSSDEMLARASQPADPHQLLEEREELGLLAAGLERLDPRRRTAILLRYIEGASSEEAAAAMGTTVGAFRVILTRGLADLRRVVAELCGELPRGAGERTR